MFVFKSVRELLGLKPKNYSLCMLVTEQEGAEIWLQGEKISECTPHLIKLEQGCPQKITFKFIGHQDHFVELVPHKELTYYYCQLERIPLRLVTNEISRNSFL